MVEIITYSLRNGNRLSDQYYRDISNFTGDLLKEIQTLSGRTIADYLAFVQGNQIEALRSFDEYAFEFLMMGVY